MSSKRPPDHPNTYERNKAKQKRGNELHIHNRKVTVLKKLPCKPKFAMLLFLRQEIIDDKMEKDSFQSRFLEHIAS